MTAHSDQVGAERMSQNLPWTWRRKTAFASTVGVVTLVLADLAIWALAGIPHPYAAGPVSPDEYVLDEFRRAPINRYVPSYHSPMLRLELKLDEKNLPGLSRTAQFTLNRFGFRSNRLVRVSKQPGVVRIFCVGGSTTECLYLDDQDAWPEVLQRLLASEALGVDVVNVGRSGDTTRDHISLLAHRILPFEPDIVIFLIGLNDLRLHMEPDYSPIRTDSRSVLPEPEVDIRVWVQARICNWSQLVRAAVWAKRRLVSADEQGNPVQDAHGVWIERARQQRRSRTLRKIDPHRYPFPEYSQNLRSLIGLCQANGALPVLMTQPALWGADSDAIEEYRDIGSATTSSGKPSNALTALLAKSGRRMIAPS